MNNFFRLSLAEAEGLRKYLRTFEGCIVPSADFQSVDQSGSGEFDFRLAGRDAHEVHLERVRGLDWTGNCSCEDEFDCDHCLAAASWILGLQPGKLVEDALQLQSASSAAAAAAKGAPAPASSRANAASELSALVRKTLSRELAPDELAYLQRVAKVWSTLGVNGGLSFDDLTNLSRTSTRPDFQRLQRLRSRPPFPRAPTDVVEMLHGVVRAVGLVGLEVPEFIQEVLRSQPAPEGWIERWRQQDLAVWDDAFTRFIEEYSEEWEERSAAARIMLGVRLLLTPGEPTVQIRSDGSGAWRSARITELRRLAERTLDFALDVEADSAALWYPMARYLSQPYRPPLSYEGEQHLLQPSSIIARLLGQRSARSSILCQDGTPVESDPVPIGWKLAPDGDSGEHFRLQMCLPDGSPIPTRLAVAQGPVNWLISPSRVHPMVDPPKDLPSLDRIPAEVITAPNGLCFLHALKAQMPESLEKRIQRVELKPCIEFLPLPGTKSERMAVSAKALGLNGKPVLIHGSEGWESTGQAGLNRRKANDPMVIFENNLLSHVPPLIERLDLKWDGGQGLFVLRMTKRFPEILSDWLADVPKEVEVRVPSDLQAFLEPPIEATVQIQVTESQVDWFDLSATIQAESTDLTPEELQLLLDAKGGFVRLAGKGWRRARISLSPEDEQRLAEMGLDTRSISSEPLRLHALQLAHSSSNRLLPEEQAQQIQRRADEIQARVTPPVPAEIQASLRPYQIEGFHFLAYLSENRFGGVLADDMGLGKTLQTLAWIAWLRSSATPDAVASRVLVVCPKSVAPNWLAEAAKFLPSLRTVLWQGEDPERFEKVLGDHDAVILNYAQLRALEDRILRQPWLAVILDEAQAIKNPDSQTAQVSRRIQAQHRLALTGTPIENRLLDLWSILSFAMPGALGPRAQFAKTFAKEDVLARRRLSARVRPFLLRRTKGQVAQDLPPRIEEDLQCELEGVQQTLYRAEYKKARALLLKLQTSADLDKFRFHFLTSLLRLRQICCHPALVDERHAHQPSAKIEALIELVEPLFEQGLKVLVFSQFTGMLQILRENFESRGWTSFYLAGDTENRGPLVDSFNAHDGAAAFFISLKAGGFGLNLTSASYVILFDPWWNPAVENQAIDRTHRIGQAATVFAYRLLVKGSIEEKIRQLQRTKSSLADDVLGEERFSQSLTLSDLQFLFSNKEAEV